jgi:hypothetical protein
MPSDNRSGGRGQERHSYLPAFQHLVGLSLSIRPQGGREKEKVCQEERREERDHLAAVASWLRRIFCRSPMGAQYSPGEVVFCRCLFSLNFPVD